MSQRRVVVTGMGLVAPNAISFRDFFNALRNQISGIKELKRLKFASTLGGVPPVTEELKKKYFFNRTLKFLSSSSVTYGCIVGVDVWLDAGFFLKDKEDNTEPYWNAGTIFGVSIVGFKPLHDAFNLVDELKVKDTGIMVVEQTMGSAPSIYLTGLIGLGNTVSSNSSACSSGAVSILDAFEYVMSERADIMLFGSIDYGGPYILHMGGLKP